MKPSFTLREIPRSRIATFDTSAVALTKHHVSAMLEFDVTESRRRLQQLRRQGTLISFNGWLIKVIGTVLDQHREAAAFLFSKRKLIIFDEINISIIVEKKVNGKPVPIPLLIEHANSKSAAEITAEIEKAKDQSISGTDIVLNRKSYFLENLYYSLPGFIRRTIWRVMLRNPRFVFRNMGNAVITSVGMMGKINGWFIQKSIHPISFGIGSILRKPYVIENEIKIRDILNMTILVDHDVIDGAPMVRFLNELTRLIETGEFTEKVPS
ncbi:MAG: 2-oxo acid dehydrogenase subunit E2 [Bacteroidales bacterium]|nr:2-oxo acid dehydrogenase subunit E2 [Bacteroidales bacterium]